MAFNIVVMIVVGGTGSISGAFCVAVIFSILTEAFRPLEETLGMYGLGEILMALILVLILIYRPAGLFGTREPGFLLAPDNRP
jgi:branched-chain amino acid transport system permease protein